jgi:hypothetical protein
MPAIPSGPTTTMAPTLCSAKPLSNAFTVVPGSTVATAVPLLRSKSEIRIAILSGSVSSITKVMAWSAGAKVANPGKQVTTRCSRSVAGP